MVLPYIVPEGMDVKEDDWFVVNTKFGEDLGIAKSGIKEIAADQFKIKKAHPETASNADVDDIVIDDESILAETHEHIPIDLESNKVIAKAKPEDIEERKRFSKEEVRAFDSAKKEIDDLGLDMKLINVHFLLQKKKVIFNFTADNRIDFRQLVKRLASIFRTRIEMRQIGVRDAAKIQGGYGVCGEICCCCRSNCHINSIFLKMAKDQGFVINSSKLTGLCGRLMCCLAYENDYYAEERKKYPEIGSIVIDSVRQYNVISVNVLKDEIFIADSQHHQRKLTHTAVRYFKTDEQGISYYRALEPSA